MIIFILIGYKKKVLCQAGTLTTSSNLGCGFVNKVWGRSLSAANTLTCGLIFYFRVLIFRICSYWTLSLILDIFDIFWFDWFIWIFKFRHWCQHCRRTCSWVLSRTTRIFNLLIYFEFSVILIFIRRTIFSHSNFSHALLVIIIFFYYLLH